VTIAERRLAIVQLSARKGREADAIAAIESVTGVGLPDPGHASSARDLMAVWAQPSSWLLMQPWRSAPSLARVIEAACGQTASIVDQTWGKAALRLCGPKARDVLAKGCRIDLHPRAFGANRAAATVIGHVDTLIIQVDDAPTFDVIVGSTYAASFLDWLEHAAEEYGCELI
jgi:sarcosine oxidase subunit gamma